ncbi:hypothetical protein BH24PSE2_BH24PSE2_00080 [soil metagenome]
MGAACGFLLGSPAPAEADSVLWEGDDQSVVLAPQDDEAASPNDHPATLAPEAIEKMLAGLQLRYTDTEAEGPPLAVFTDEQLAILGEAVATGLARASPSQDIIFSLIGARHLSPGAFARRNRLTAGRVFLRDGQLNLIFGELLSPYRKKNVYGRVDEDFHPRRFGSRAAPEDHDAVLITSASASLHRGPDGERRDWVVFDRALARTEAAPQPELPPAVSPPAAAPPAPPEAPEPEAPEPESGAAADVEQRLKTLKRLRERDLIPEETYRKKIDEILEDL